jgi:hypothetical protein
VVLRELCWSTAESCAGRPLAPPVCAAAKDPKIGALVAAIGVLDGHGSAADESDLARMVPDPDARAEVLDVAAQVMEHRQFKAVRDALWRTLTFKDHLSRGQIQKIAASVTTTPDADLPPGEPCVEVTTLRPVSGARSFGGKGRGRGTGEPPTRPGVPRSFRGGPWMT